MARIALYLHPLRSLLSVSERSLQIGFQNCSAAVVKKILPFCLWVLALTVSFQADPPGYLLVLSLSQSLAQVTCLAIAGIRPSALSAPQAPGAKDHLCRVRKYPKGCFHHRLSQAMNLNYSYAGRPPKTS